jgi:hypothetical protein
MVVELVRSQAGDLSSSMAVQVVLPAMGGTLVMERSAPMMSSETVFFVLVMDAPIMLGAASGISRDTIEDTIAVLEVTMLIADHLILTFGGMIFLEIVLILVVSMMPKNA